MHDGMLDVLLNELGEKNCHAIIDDITTTSRDVKTHAVDVKNVLTALEDTGLLLQLRGCRFSKQYVEYFGKYNEAA